MSDTQARMRADENAEWLYDWPTMFARPNQLEPAGKWNTWLLLAGRGFGKTRTAAEWIRSRVERGKARRIALLGRTSGEVRDVMIEGESGILAISPPWFKPIYEPSKRRLTWPNGAIATTFTADEPDMLRGPQFDCFTAGTMIATPDGERPIESLRVGDLVVTRSGPRRVVEARDRVAAVGGVDFADGRFLVGTEEHPVLTTLGWTNLKSLTMNSILFDGSKASKAIWSPIATENSIGSIAGSGNALLDLSRLVSTFITRTATLPTTGSAIWRQCLRELIDCFTVERIVASASAQSAALPWPGSSTTLPTQSARRVSSERQTQNGARTNASASSAENHFVRVALASAPSVAQTWREAGRQRVYNITVEDAHEFFANGVLVHNCAWCDELASFRFVEAWDNLRFGLRLGKRPRVIVSTTPRPTAIIRELVADPSTHVTTGSTHENKANLAEDFLKRIIAKYEGTRLGKQEIHAEILDDTLGALWTQKIIEEHRVKEVPYLRRIVVAIDPSTTSNEDSDECGIVCAGVSDNGHGYVFDDISDVLSPNEWAKAAIKAYKKHGADRIVAEVNNGGDLVEITLRAVEGGRDIPYKKVHASRGKATRAEPVSALYEQGKVHHVGAFSKLESQMCTWVPGVTAKSPDRMDALVWALTELMLGAGSSVSDLDLSSGERQAPHRIT